MGKIVVSVIGAGGKMGTRTSNNLAKKPEEFDLLLVEASEAGIQSIKDRGFEPTPVEEALETLGISGIEVLFGALADIFTGKADLFVVSEELEADYRDMPVIGLEDLTDSDLAAEKLKQVVEMR